MKLLKTGILMASMTLYSCSLGFEEKSREQATSNASDDNPYMEGESNEALSLTLPELPKDIEIKTFHLVVKKALPVVKNARDCEAIKRLLSDKKRDERAIQALQSHYDRRCKDVSVSTEDAAEEKADDALVVEEISGDYVAGQSVDLKLPRGLFQVVMTLFDAEGKEVYIGQSRVMVLSGQKNKLAIDLRKVESKDELHDVDVELKFPGESREISACDLVRRSVYAKCHRVDPIVCSYKDQSAKSHCTRYEAANELFKSMCKAEITLSRESIKEIKCELESRTKAQKG